MATTDLSRKTHDPRYHRRQVLGQVGRVLTDEDISAIGDVAFDETRADRLGIIGAHGTSNHGFRVSAAAMDDGFIDFTLEAGDYWIGGHRATLLDDTTFRLQPDWLTRPEFPLPNAPRHDLVVLELFTLPVSATEQEASADPGLGGPDTVAHLRMMARVRLETDLAEGACHDLWSETLGRWELAGDGTLDPDDHGLRGDGELSVGFTDASGAMDLCSPDIAQGFLGAANRAIRVQMTSPNTFCWGFENGGRLMRAQVDAAGTGLTLLTEPLDEAHWPSVGQVIEVLPWGAVDFNGEKLAGEDDATHFTTATTGYVPETGELTLTDALPPGFNDAWQSRPDSADLQTTRFGEDAQQPFVFVRVWDRGEDRTSAPELAIGVDVELGLTGLTVTHGGTVLRRGDAWSIAVRPNAPDDLAPWELHVGTQPISRTRFYAPLAHLDWDGAGGLQITDCRTRFRPLTRLNDCVTLRVGDGSASHGDYDRIQDAVDALPATGGRILVLPGEYDEHVTLSQLGDIRIEGCGPRTLVRPADPENGIPDDTPIFTIEGCTNITLKDMAIEAPLQLGVGVRAFHPGPDQAGNTPDPIGNTDIVLDHLAITHFQRGGIWMAATTGGTIRHCALDAAGAVDAAALAEDIHRPAIHVQGLRLRVAHSSLSAPDDNGKRGPVMGGLRIGGGSEDIQVTENLIEGGYGTGIMLGSLIYVPETALGNEAALARLFLLAWGIIAYVRGFRVSEDNCFGVDPIPPGRDPENPNDPPLVPIPDGPLYDIRIEANRIRNMGGHGIGVAQFFNLDEYPFLITVEDMVILRNEITGCLSGENLPFPPEMQLVAAWAGIALADVTRVEIRENTIRDNARRHTLPAMGIFALFAENLEIVENTIAANGLRVDEIDGVGAGPGGWRGGVAVTQVRPAPRAGDFAGVDDVLRSDSSTALVVHGNSIRAPQGRALTGFGLGPMQVTDNRLVTQSGATNGWILGLFNLRRFGRLSLLGLVLQSLYTIITQTDRPNSTNAHLLLSILGGDVVALGNLGVSNEIYLQNLGLGDMLLGDEMELGFDAPGWLRVGGDVQLNDNQIRLDGMDGESSFGISAVALASLDSVMAQSNQISLDFDTDLMGINLLALGWSVHVADNRLKEGLLNCFCSGLTLGLMNTTTDNQATHCLLPFGPEALRYDEGNTEMIELLLGGANQPRDEQPCDIARAAFTSQFMEDLKGFVSALNQGNATTGTTTNTPS